MAWIKLDHLTPDKPEVIGIAAILGIDQDAALGKLARVWIWADQQAIAGIAVGNAVGNAKGNALVTAKMFIDRCACHRGFADAMIEVGWLDVSSKGVLSFPNFDRHNGETAKQRALTARRVAKHKKSKNGEVTQKVTPGVTEEVTDDALPKALLLRNQESESEADSDLTDHKRCAFKDSAPASSAKDLGARLAKQAGYAGGDGAIFIQAAALVGHGLSDADVSDAAEACRVKQPKNVPGYFRRTLADRLAKRGDDFEALLAGKESR